MPAIKEAHTDTYSVRVDGVVILLLNKKEYLQSNRLKDLRTEVAALYHCSIRTADRLISAAKKEIRKLTQKNKEKAYKNAIHDREYIIRKAKSDGDNKLALQAMDSRDKLQGLFIDKIEGSGEMTVKNVDMSRFTEHGLERIKRGDKIEEVLLDPKSVKVE